jgi:hypothetical protein
MMRPLIMAISLLVSLDSNAQLSMESIRTSFVLYPQRTKMEKGLHDYTINGSFSLPLNKETEYRYQSAFWAISQFLVADSNVMAGFRKTADGYDSLDRETRRSFLEALYAVNPAGFEQKVWAIIQDEPDPRLTAMGILFLFRRAPGEYTVSRLLGLARQKFPATGNTPQIEVLGEWLRQESTRMRPELPPAADLFQFNKDHGIKAVYSFQRHDRDQQGMAIVQYEDGRFARDSGGKLISIRQLARSGSSLPYFLTNGNTPQGIYSIQGIDTSFNNFIGPTPNLQLFLPNECWWRIFYHDEKDTADAVAAYRSLLPETWMYHAPMMESFTAGKLGRTEIICHGTTIDPAFFKGKPYYPISPTLGCLCARESWNTTTGKLIESEQFRLAQTFLKTSLLTGYLFVIELDDQHHPVSAEELEKLAKGF